MTPTGRSLSSTADDPDTDRSAGIVLGAAVFAMGLLAGLYFFSAIAVMPALTAAEDRTLVDAMQQMIDKIENPAFFLVLLGAPVLASVALVQARRSGSREIAGWIVAGLVLYAVMVVITFAINIPLNDDLQAAGDPDQIEDLAAVRDDFVTPLGRVGHRPDGGDDGGLRRAYLGTRPPRPAGAGVARESEPSTRNDTDSLASGSPRTVRFYWYTASRATTSNGGNRDERTK